MLSLSINAKALKPVKSVYDYKLYPEDLESGFYVVPECLVEGMEPTNVYLVYWVQDTRYILSSMILPPNIERPLEIKENKENALHALHVGIDEILHSLNELKTKSVTQVSTSGGLDSDTLLKALAVAQKPDLIKDM